MHTEIKMMFVYAALLLLISYFASVAFLLSSLDLSIYTDVKSTCEATQVSSALCQAQAFQIALVTCGAAVLSLLVALSLHIREGTTKTRQAPEQANFEFPVLILLATISLLLMLHFFIHQRAPIGRVRILQSESWLISAENLTWPLMLQLAFWASGWRKKMVFIAYLATIAALSPFRNIVFVLLFFGTLVPTVTMLTGQPQSRKKRWLILSAALSATLFGGMIVLAQTASRYASFTSDSSDQTNQIALVTHAIASRAITPVFQAGMAEHLGRTILLPNAADSLLKKLRLSKTDNLNEHLFKYIYSGNEIGETTSLLFGEAAANSMVFGGYWTFSALILLVLIYRFINQYMDIGVLVGVSMWRGSMGGLFDVLPALVLQVAFCAALTAWNIHRSKGRGPKALSQ